MGHKGLSVTLCYSLHNSVLSILLQQLRELLRKLQASACAYQSVSCYKYLLADHVWYRFSASTTFYLLVCLAFKYFFVCYRFQSYQLLGWKKLLCLANIRMFIYLLFGQQVHTTMFMYLFFG